MAKLLAALRVSTVLTFLLTEQLLLAYVLIPELRERFWTLVVFLAIIAATCLCTSTIGLLCSALPARTAGGDGADVHGPAGPVRRRRSA